MKRYTRTNILILNYNGLDLMKECLPSILDAAEASRRKVTVTVIDNVSTDGSLDYLRKEFPKIVIYESPENKILCTYNEALKTLQEEIVILLNNDIKVDRDFIDPLIDRFEDDEALFSAGCCCRDFDGKGFQGEKSIGGIKYGMFWTNSRYAGHEQDIPLASWTLQVALGAFDRRKFLELGGYDPLFLPGTWEDTDVSLRAYQAGWHCIYEPASVIFHKGQVTFHRVHGKRGSTIISDRNAFLFFWKNFGQTPFMLAHVFFLPLRLLFCLVRGNTAFVTAFFLALKRGGCAFRKGRLDCPQQRTYGEILSLFGNPRGHLLPSAKLTQPI